MVFLQCIFLSYSGHVVVKLSLGMRLGVENHIVSLPILRKLRGSYKVGARIFRLTETLIKNLTFKAILFKNDIISTLFFDKLFFKNVKPMA